MNYKDLDLQNERVREQIAIATVEAIRKATSSDTEVSSKVGPPRERGEYDRVPGGRQENKGSIMPPLYRGRDDGARDLRSANLLVPLPSPRSAAATIRDSVGKDASGSSSNSVES